MVVPIRAVSLSVRSSCCCYGILQVGQVIGLEEEEEVVVVDEGGMEREREGVRERCSDSPRAVFHPESR